MFAQANKYDNTGNSAEGNVHVLTASDTGHLRPPELADLMDGDGIDIVRIKTTEEVGTNVFDTAYI